MRRYNRALTVTLKSFFVVLAMCILLAGCETAGGQSGNVSQGKNVSQGGNNSQTETAAADGVSEAERVTKVQSVAEVPEYSGEPYVILQNNEPNFTEAELRPEAFEEYSDLDELERCGTAEACIGTELMPTEKRGSIGQVKPSGWHTVKYDDVEGKYLYNRCHLIGYQLTAENANEKNLITGTRYLNVDGMLPFENMVADYIKETDNHVLYRVTPVYEGDDLVASGIVMEAKSVEDEGEGICFNVYVYNVQPGFVIDYETGESRPDENASGERPAAEVSGQEKPGQENTYILNSNSRKIHKPDCSSVKDIKDSNKEEYTGSREKLLEQGYTPCGRCKP